MVLRGLLLTSVCRIQPNNSFTTKLFSKELKYAWHLCSLPFSNFTLALWREASLVAAGGGKAAQVHKPCYVWERAAFPWVMCMTTAIGQGIKLSLLQQKLSILYLSHKKKESLIWSSFLEGCRIPPCLWHPSCICQVLKSITLTTLCITVIAWVGAGISVTITKADSHRLVGAPCSKL